MYEGLEALLCEIYSILLLSMFDKSFEIKAESLGDCYIVAEGMRYNIKPPLLSFRSLSFELHKPHRPSQLVVILSQP